MKDQENFLCHLNMKTSTTLSRLMFSLLLLIAVPYLFYSINSLKILRSPPNPSPLPLSLPVTLPVHLNVSTSEPLLENPKTLHENTTLHHIVFGIGASSKLWDHRKNYIKLWWRPDEMRGIVWLDEHVKKDPDDDNLLPPIMISSNTSDFPYKNPKGHRSAIRISRIISETLKLGMKDVRWFVMGDDDTVFVADNLVRVLSKYDHNQYYYIGSSSESHLQNIYFSYGMAYGGGGFAISYPLAKELARMQDRCIKRYPELYGSDDRIQACMAELGVPLTREPGFHQYDVYGNLYGLLAAHPIAPLVSLHHLDLVEPIFPDMDRIQSLQKLKVPMQLDSAGLMQQSICYDQSRQWTISVSWGYTVQIFRGIIPPREIEKPARTFLNWYPKAGYKAFAFNTRSLSKNSCQRPSIYCLADAVYTGNNKNGTVSMYVGPNISNPDCKWKISNPSQIVKVEVYKRPDPYFWNKAPRRNCCRILATKKKRTLAIDVGECQKDEVIEIR